MNLCVAAMPSKKDQLLQRSRNLIQGKKITSLADFQEISTDIGQEPVERQELATKQEPISKSRHDVPSKLRTKTYINVQKRTLAEVSLSKKTARENFRFTEELAMALEKCAGERRMKKNVIVEIALEDYLKREGYL